MFAYRADFKNSNWEFGVGEVLTLLSVSKRCGVKNFEPLYLLLSVTLLPCAFETLCVILFLGFVFCVHHWNVSPEVSMREVSNPGQ